MLTMKTQSNGRAEEVTVASVGKTYPRGVNVYFHLMWPDAILMCENATRSKATQNELEITVKEQTEIKICGAHTVRCRRQPPRRAGEAASA